MTLVVDASVVAEVLLNTSRSGPARRHLAGEHLVAPSHLTAEVTSVVRGWMLGGHLREADGVRALREFPLLGIDLVDMTPRLPAVLALRHNRSAYDALYVVLARDLECALLTLDARVVRAAPDCAVTP
ncbi:type II toxin-antitoxin system VapC family toxin [Brachybacterium sp. EF45031]|uniref:type II toxin-antitoxin system VapC family toxin n=1 Tax=Brachybacterium sillae TaxID=2810536 RepID=UPI00217E1212|nr:type II toxin-antitoxin system VapC family toxin [Brachybacterium sillae]MCS6711896.1 type II toxin-antitoxin system VapC family toxin [Brachybacterium sillae]